MKTAVDMVSPQSPVRRAKAARILLAGSRQLHPLRTAWLHMLAVAGGICGTFALAAIFTTFKGARLPPDFGWLFVIAGALWLAWFCVLLVRRELVLHTGAGRLVLESGIAWSIRQSKYMVSDFERVSIEDGKDDKKGYSVHFRSADGDGLLVADELRDWDEAMKLAVTAAGSTGLALEDCARGRNRRLAAEEIEPHFDTHEALPDKTPWWRDRKALSIVFIGAIPLVGIFLLGWNVLAVMLVFWMENVVIGVFAFARLMIAWRDETTDDGQAADGLRIWKGMVFLAHYGGFCLINVLLIVSFAQTVKVARGTSPWIPYLNELWNVLSRPDMLVAIAVLVFNHGVTFYRHHIKTRAYETSTVDDEFTSPYGRVLLLSIFLFAIMLLVMILETPTIGAVLLTGLKVCFDIATLRKWRRMRPTPGMTALFKAMDAQDLNPPRVRTSR